MSSGFSSCSVETVFLCSLTTILAVDPPLGALLRYGMFAHSLMTDEVDKIVY